MSLTLVERDQQNKLIERIASLEAQVQALRANQNQKIQFGNITIDGSGTQGTITIGSTITITATTANQGTILVSDGVNNRILIGYGSGLF